jgi:hypothetical protein
MTNFREYLSQIKPIPGKKKKKWLRKRQAEIQRENEGLTPEQIRERLRRIVEEDRLRRAERAKAEADSN